MGLPRRALRRASSVRRRSSSSSSAIRMVMGRRAISAIDVLPLHPAGGAVLLDMRDDERLLVLVYRKGDAEHRAHARRAVGHDLAAVALGDLATQRKPDPGARVLHPRVQSLEDPEDARAVLRVEPDAVVVDGDLRQAV